MNKSMSVPIALALFSACASAQQSVGAAGFADRLAADGLKPISEGLYGTRSGTDESYVAFTPAGERALLQRLLELRDDRAHAKAPPASIVLGRLVGALCAPALAGDRYGDCNGPATSGPFHVQAAASGGVSASASAANASSPTLATTHHAYADAYDAAAGEVGNDSTTADNVTASASIVAPNLRTACQTTSAATITCAGASRPAIAAFATSTSPAVICRQ